MSTLMFHFMLQSPAELYNSDKAHVDWRASDPAAPPPEGPWSPRRRTRERRRSRPVSNLDASTWTLGFGDLNARVSPPLSVTSVQRRGIIRNNRSPRLASSPAENNPPLLDGCNKRNRRPEKCYWQHCERKTVRGENPNDCSEHARVPIKEMDTVITKPCWRLGIRINSTR
ncbi:hypothetical protein PUN28_007134 [Cardiocondyla obscurior]|uniref:Uncharacterized protein n=1 Tax=Cardiocondyla obscurior TaxID=286306 RepID=A0AAW2G815_9HYME